MSETQPTPVPQRRQMQLIAERQVPDQVPLATSQQPSVPVQPTNVNELQFRRSFIAGVVGSINVAAQILAVRLILLLATVGAFVLAWMAIQTAQPLQLGAVALYLAGVILPLVWLSGRR